LALVVGAVVLVVYSRRAKRTETDGRTKYKVLYAYIAQTPDEIHLKENDIIILHDQFGDGWASGYNERSKKTGSFPFQYVSPTSSSRLMMMVRPVTIYHRISRAFGGNASQQGQGGSSATLTPQAAFSQPPPPPPSTEFTQQPQQGGATASSLYRQGYI